MTVTINGFVHENFEYGKYVDSVETISPYAVDTAGYSKIVVTFEGSFSTAPTTLSVDIRGSDEPTFSRSYSLTAGGGVHASQVAVGGAAGLTSFELRYFPRYVKASASMSPDAVGAYRIGVYASR